MNTDTIEPPVDTRPRSERRQALRDALNPRTYRSIVHSSHFDGKMVLPIQRVRCSVSNGGERLPKQSS